MGAVEVALRAPGEQRLAPGVAEHVSGCPLCRAALVLVVQGLAGAGGAAGRAERCAELRADLAPLLDREQADPAGAARAYPQLWRHIWSCPDCLREYLMAHALLDALAEGAIPPLRLPARPAAPRPLPLPIRIVIPRRGMLAAVPALRGQGAPLRGADDSAFVLYEDAVGGSPYRVTVEVQEAGAEALDLHATVTPPAEGRFIAVIGAARFSAPFSSGAASIRGIPARLLTDPDAPELELLILPAGE